MVLRLECFSLTLHYPESFAFPLLSFTFVCSPRLLKQEVKIRQGKEIKLSRDDLEGEALSICIYEIDNTKHSTPGIELEFLEVKNHIFRR